MEIYKQTNVFFFKSVVKKKNILLLGESVSLLCKAHGISVTTCSIQTWDLRETFCGNHEIEVY